jgi:hypothetical protein
MIKKSKIYSVIMLLIVITETSAFAQDNKKTPTSSLKSKSIPAANFKQRDIGSPSIKGTVRVLSNGIDMTAGGVDIWGVKDEFNFIYVERSGDFDIVSRIESLSAADLYTKAGLMAREDLTASCRHIYFQVFADNNPRNKNNGGYEFQYRTAKDSTMKAIYPKSYQGKPAFPVSFPNTWIRLQRIKNDFIGYYSADGKTWQIYTTFALELPVKVYLGLAVTSHNAYHAVSAKFRNIAELIH